MTPRILVIGHSHINVLTPLDGLEGRFDLLTFPVVGATYGDRDRAEFEAMARAGYAAVVFMLGGSRHVALGMLEPPRDPFDFYLPEEPGLAFDSRSRLMPVDAVASVLRRHMKRECDQLAELSGIFSGHRRFHVESPPPCPSEHIRQHPGGFAELLRERDVASATFRYKLWRLHSQVMREFCAAHDLHFVPAPDGTQDVDGCLKPAYLRADPAHANADYGVQLVRQLRALVEPVATETP